MRLGRKVFHVGRSRVGAADVREGREGRDVRAIALFDLMAGFLGGSLGRGNPARGARPEGSQLVGGFPPAAPAHPRSIAQARRARYSAAWEALTSA